MEERPHRETKKVARVERFAHAARATGGAVVFVNARENVTSSSSSGKKKKNNTKKLNKQKKMFSSRRGSNPRHDSQNHYRAKLPSNG